MGERDAIERSDEPVTRDRLAADLRALGVQAGDTLLVHSSLNALGWVCGGAPAVVDALFDVVTDAGTVVMPTHSTDHTDPDYWENPPIPDGWTTTVRETMTPYRPDVTPTRGMGAVAECFRNCPDVRRSRHPSHSFAAWGTDAEFVVDGHSFDHPMGEESPLARIYDRDGNVLLLGSTINNASDTSDTSDASDANDTEDTLGHDRNTSLHLADERADYPKETATNGGPVLVDGERRWVTYETIAYDDEDFPEVKAAFEATGEVTSGPVGAGAAKLLGQRALVDFAADWFEAHRGKTE